MRWQANQQSSDQASRRRCEACAGTRTGGARHYVCAWRPPVVLVWLCELLVVIVGLGRALGPVLGLVSAVAVAACAVLTQPCGCVRVACSKYAGHYTELEHQLEATRGELDEARQQVQTLRNRLAEAEEATRAQQGRVSSLCLDLESSQHDTAQARAELKALRREHEALLARQDNSAVLDAVAGSTAAVTALTAQVASVQHRVDQVSAGLGACATADATAAGFRALTTALDDTREEVQELAGLGERVEQVAAGVQACATTDATAAHFAALTAAVEQVRLGVQQVADIDARVQQLASGFGATSQTATGRLEALAAQVDTVGQQVRQHVAGVQASVDEVTERSRNWPTAEATTASLRELAEAMGAVRAEVAAVGERLKAVESAQARAAPSRAGAASGTLKVATVGGGVGRMDPELAARLQTMREQQQRLEADARAELEARSPRTRPVKAPFSAEDTATTTSPLLAPAKAPPAPAPLDVDSLVQRVAAETSRMVLDALNSARHTDSGAAGAGAGAGAGSGAAARNGKSPSKASAAAAPRRSLVQQRIAAFESGGKSNSAGSNGSGRSPDAAANSTAAAGQSDGKDAADERLAHIQRLLVEGGFGPAAASAGVPTSPLPTVVGVFGNARVAEP